MSQAQLTFRDRVKFACLLHCTEAGMDENEMIATFQSAIDRLKRDGVKTAALGWVSPSAKALGYMAVLGLPAVGLGSAALGKLLGQTAKNVQIGRIPTTDELKLLDEIAAYNRTADEIKRRTDENEFQRKEKSKPSVRRMF